MDKRLLYFFLSVWLIADQGHAQLWQSKGIGGGGAFFSPMISPHNTDELWVSSDMSGFYRTTDYGNNWNLLDAEQLQGSTTVSISFTSQVDSLYAINHSSQNGMDMQRPVFSNDGGQTWSPLPDPTAGGAYTIYADPQRSDTYLLAGYDKLWFTNNKGQNYQLIYTFSNGGNGIHFAGAWISTETQGLWKATGLQSVTTTFTREHSFPFKQPERIFFHNGSMWVTTFGGGLYRTPYSPASLQETRFSDLKAYPNPASETIRLDVSGEPCEVIISDIHGRYIKTSPSNFEISVCELAPGMYFLSAGRNEITKVVRFVKK